VLQVLPMRQGVRPDAPGGAVARADEDTRAKQTVRVSLASIGLSLVNREPSEIMYLSVGGLELNLTSSLMRSTLSLAVRHIQIDNQLSTAVFPVFLQPSWVEEDKAIADARAGGGSASAAKPAAARPPAIELLVEYNLGRRHRGAGFFETFSLRVQTMQVMVDTLFVRTLLLYAFELYTDIMQILEHVISAVLPAVFGEPDGEALSQQNLRIERDEKVYVHWLNIQPLRVLVSCRSVAGVNAIEAFTREAPAGSLSLLVPVASLLANVDRVPVRLKTLALDNAFTSKQRLLNSIASSYKEQVLSQLYKALLSLDVLGNPRGLFRKLGTGVQDFFFEPMEGIFKGPEEFKQGVAKGTSSFQDNVLGGVGESLHKLSGALGNSLAELTHDKTYLEKRSAGNTAVVRQQMAPGVGAPKRNVAEGALHAGDQIVSGVARGLTGLFSKPLEGAKQKGVEGFVKGLGSGAIGLVVKPVVGITDAVTDAFEHTATDVRQLTGVFAQRVRLPRTLGHSGELTAFSEYDAVLQQQLWLVTQPGKGGRSGEALKAIRQGRYAAGRACGGPGAVNSKRLIVTTKHVLSLNVGGSGGGSSRGEGDAQLEWYEALTSIATCEESSAEVVLHLRQGGMRFVPCAGGTSQRRAVFEIIDRALRAIDLTASRPRTTAMRLK